MVFDLIVIGGGAAGFFGAIQVASHDRRLSVLILERTSKLLTKVKVSGGGRCNVTHNCLNPFELARHYPRGEKSLKQLFQTFHAGHMTSWLTSRSVALKTEDDGRVFPVTNDSQTIVDCFLREATRLSIAIETNQRVVGLTSYDGIFKVKTEVSGFEARHVLMAMGGNAKAEAYHVVSDLGHKIIAPIPSLFTFNDKDNRFKDLMGVSVNAAEVRIPGTKLNSKGPVLITHWGLSGPAVIRLSAWAAVYLHEKQYAFEVLVNWTGVNEDLCRKQLIALRGTRSKQKMVTNPTFDIAQRLWQRLCVLSDIEESRTWGDTSLKQINRMVENLTHCTFHINGKTTFKEEFVTCGGVELNEVHLSTMESKVVKNLYFAGEVLNIDGETGGFNFQAAWSTAHIAAQGILAKAQSLGQEHRDAR